mmetsp:Transcript_25101/g.39575  ORF Transcript_25101/g.39575 Transcript_25101/m.39575 type:complete len:100 (+) Transcript_25101:603-902(+)
MEEQKLADLGMSGVDSDTPSSNVASKRGEINVRGEEALRTTEIRLCLDHPPSNERCTLYWDSNELTREAKENWITWIRRRKAVTLKCGIDMYILAESIN